MWPEPLTPVARDLDEYRFAVEVTAATGAVVASADALVNRGAGCGYLAEVRILDATRGIRQRRRAIVLLIREACRHAQALGITSVHSDSTPARRELGERLAGRTGVPIGGRFRIAGDLAAIRTRVLAVSDADGNDGAPAGEG